MKNTKRAIVFGAGGFIGSYLTKRLKSEGYYVLGISSKLPQFSKCPSDEFIILDIKNYDLVYKALEHRGHFDEVYNFAANTGGATYINSGENDADSFSDSIIININIAKLCVALKVNSLFFPSSACVYSKINNSTQCIESEVYPAYPDNEYGWVKLLSERMYESHRRNYGLNVKIARLHSIVGPESQWRGGKEKAHSALARKVVMIKKYGETIDVIGNGEQIRTFLYIDDCIDAIRLLMQSDVNEIVNIGSPTPISINQYIYVLRVVSGKTFSVNHIEGPTGITTRGCSIDKIQSLLGWYPKIDITESTKLTYDWIKSQIEKTNG